MVYRRFGLLKYLTPFIASAAIVLGCAARAAETNAQSNAATVHAHVDADGMSWCRVSGARVNIRVGPNTSTQVFSELHSGEYIRAKPVQKDWLEMEWPKNIPAWVLKNSIASNDGKNGSVRTPKARIMGLGTNSAPELAVLDRGSRVTILGESGDWFQVQAPSAARAYISAKFVVVGVQAPAEEVPLPPEPKAATNVRHDRGAETVDLSALNHKQKEYEAIPADVVIVQREAAWPKSAPMPYTDGAKRASVDAPGKILPKVPNVAAAKTSDDSMFSSAADIQPSKNKIGIDEHVAQTTNANKLAAREELSRVALAEQKRFEKIEADQKVAEAKRLAIEEQTAEAAKRKQMIEADITRLAALRKKEDDADALRQANEKKRLNEIESARVAAEDRKKADLIEQSRLAAERKSIEDAEKEKAQIATRNKVEIETQAKVAAEQKKLLEEEIVRLSDAKKKAEQDELIRVAAEKKRIGEAESARIAAEARKVALEEQAANAAQKKLELETAIAKLANAKKKEEQDAALRIAKEKKLVEDAELARKNIDAQHKAEMVALAKKEAEKKKLDDAELVRIAADAKRRSELAEQERESIARKKALEVEIAKLASDKQKLENDAVARAAAGKIDTENAEVVRLESRKKKAEIDELTKIVAEKKHVADEEAARATAERKRADVAEAARVTAEKKHADELAAAKVASERKQADELAAQKAAAMKREAEEAVKAAQARRTAEDLAAKQASERKRAEEAELARVAAAKKRVEDEAAAIAADMKKKQDLEKSRVENERKMAELEAARVEAAKVATAKKTSERLPDLMNDDALASSNKGVALASDKTLMLNESDLATHEGEPNERNYDSNYVPKRIADLKKRFVIPSEAPKRAQIVGETVDVDLPPVSPAAKAPAPAAKPATQLQTAETVELPARVAEAPKVHTGPAVVHVNDATFASEIENYKGTVLVDFSATWCGPCQRLAPTIDQLGEEFRGRVKVVKIDVDEAPNTARRYNANSIPMLVMIKNGRTISSQVGAPSRDYLQTWMQNNADVPTRTETPTQVENAPKPKSLGMNLIPKEQRSIVSDVGTLERIPGLDIEGVKYVLRNNGVPLRFIIEPSDVDMSPLVGRTISISGTTIGRSYSDVSVIQMKNASTFG
ncbi:MAG: thioredoxin domain-containing protein [Planctomycetota bacterium]